MAKRGGSPGMGGGMNMNNMMKQVQKMQKQMEDAQKALEEAEFSATAGGGAVEVTMTGKKVLTKVTLDPDAVDPDDVEMLEDLIMVAVNDAMKKVDEASSSSMAKMTGGMGGFPF